MLHYRQLLRDGKFRRLDYGREINIQKYGTEDPPEYDLKKISGNKISLVCGKTDLLASPLDYTKLRDVMTENNNDVDFQEYEEGHIGLIVPKDPTLTNNMLEIIKRDWGL